MKFDPTLTWGLFINGVVLISAIGAAWGSIKRRLDAQDEERKTLYTLIQQMSQQLQNVNERVARMEGRWLKR